MRTLDFVSNLRRRDIRIWADGDRLRYSAPPGSLTPGLREELAHRKEEILRFLRSATVGPISNREPIARAPRDEPLPLSFAQQRLWFLDRLDPGSPLYNAAEAMRIGPGLDAEALRKALDAVVGRHEILRTNFTAVDGEPRQIIKEPRPVEVVLHDLRQCPEADLETEIQRRLRKEAGRPFDLSRDIMLRAALIQLRGGAHVFLLVTHHIACDGWSMGLLFEELCSLYQGFSTNCPPKVPELVRQYADYASWQRQWMRGDVLSSLLGYWKEKLGDGLPTLNLPTDRPRAPSPTHRGASRSFVVPRSVTTRLDALNIEEGVTPFMTLLAAFQTLLHRFTGQTDIVVGSPVGVYNRFELEPLIGFWVNTLVLRSDLSGGPTFRELLCRTRDTALEAYAHQELPFDLLVDELHPQRDPSRNPLFQVMFILQVQNAPGRALSRAGLDVRPIEVEQVTSKFDLTLSMAEDSGRLAGWFEYDTDLFDDTTIERWISHFRTLLDGIATNPDAPIASLPLLAESERRELLIDRNETARDYPRESRLHQLFEEQVERTPDAVAVVFGGATFTYRELNARSNQLARFLRRHGVGAEALVGICVEPSLEMLVGLLGILKAGGAYVPMDPTYPAERLRYMVEDARVGLLLTQAPLLDLLPDCGARKVCLDRDWEDVSGETTDNPDVEGTSADLAYVIFTSGSTGRPKGVQIAHRALVNFLTSMREAPGLTRDDVLLSVTTISFDIAALELFLPILAGARVVLVSREEAANGARLSQRITDSEATVMQATPATWRLLVEAGWRGSDRLKILCGGEALPRELAAQLLERGRSLWNLYGPTETTVWSTTAEIKRAAEIGIGRPIANTQVYVLDEELRPVPIGVPGDLYIGGDGLSRGYLNRPELTGEAFIEHPFRTGERLYRTGDLARWRPSGELEFLGRLDDQVKLRGFRIELGEIESVLNAEPGVRQAVVVAREDRPGDKRLVAYYCTEGEAVALGDLRRRVKARLPDYMVPSDFVRLEAFPLTPNGKVDRRSLPSPGGTAPRDDGGYVAPRDALEQQLAGLWESVLDRRPIGVKDNFFDVGGHSLLAARLFDRMEHALGVNLPLATLFHASTVEELAERLRRRDWSPSWDCLVPIQTTGSRPPLFLVHGAGGNVLLYRDLARRLGADQPVYGLQSRGLDGSERYLTNFREMAAHYVREIRTVQPEGPYCLGGYCLGGALAYEMARQLRASGDDVRLVAFFETYNIRSPRVSRSALYRVYHLVQNVSFHLRNLNLLNHKEKLTFVQEKAAVARRRIRRRLASLLSGLKHRLRRTARRDDGGMPHVLLTKVNDRAHADYEPEPYSGRVVLYKPQGVFAGSDDPKFGWSELIPDLETHLLPIYPRGMLVEPFVKILAERLRADLEKVAADEGHRARAV